MPFGYLAVLLSYLSINVSVRAYVAVHLQGRTVRPLLDAVEEFLFYHRKVAEEVRQSDDDVDLKTVFVGRLQAVVDLLRREEDIESTGSKN